MFICFFACILYEIASALQQFKISYHKFMEGWRRDMFCLLLLLSLLLLIFLSFIFVSLFLSSFVFCLHSPWFHSYLNRSNQHSINWIQINLTFTGSDKIIDATKKNILDEKKYFISTCFDHHCVVYSKDQIAIEWIFLLLLERRHWRFESTNLNISSIYFIIHFMLAKILLYQLICLTFVFIFFFVFIWTAQACSM